MMANPRKFSEKIALHHQKQAEGTAAFEQIMKEVSGATRGACPSRHHLRIQGNQSFSSYRGGSLPNVNQMTNNNNDLQNALDDLETIADRVNRDRGRTISPHRNRQSPLEKKVPHDVSPYGSPYLPVPLDSNWRRTNSDSALHQSAMGLQETVHGNYITQATIRRAQEMDGNCLNDGQYNYLDPKKLCPGNHSRPKSCDVPGISIIPSNEEPGVVHVPISNNTGSLPDLTNLHFPSPLATPLDAEDQSLQNAYSQHTPPHNNSLSPPTLSPQQHTHLIGSGVVMQSNSGLQSNCVPRHSSPGPSPSPSSRRRIHPNQTNLIMGTGSSRRQHIAQQQGLVLDTSALTLDSYPPSFGIYPHDQPLSPSQTSASFMSQLPGSYRSGMSPSDQSCSAPTSPASHTLSPVGSPSISPNNKISDNNYFMQHQQTSALQHQLEQFKMMADGTDHTDQFFMLNENNAVCTTNNISHPNTADLFFPNLSGSGCGPPVGGLNLGTDLQYNDSQHLNNIDGLDSSVLYYGVSSASSDSNIQSPTLYSRSSVISSHQPLVQTPQTPTSIPDIILTAPGGDEPIMRQDFAKDLGSAMASMSSSFESDLFPGDEALRVGLEPIDFDGLQILTDPDIPVISDPSAEENFRLDHS